MSRYIDADEFGRCLRNYRPYVDSGRFNAIQTEVNQVLDCIEYEIEDAPSIDIVRCGECKYTEFCEKKIHRHGISYNIDFCSYGSRSEKPNNCEDLQDWKDRMWAEAIVTEPTISKMEQVDWKDQMWKEAVEQREHDILYEPTYDIDDGSM